MSSNLGAATTLIGVFGVDPNNPVSATDDDYFRRLRCPGGHPYYFHRIGSVDNGPSAHRFDCAELLCFRGEDRRFVFFNMYARRNSDKPPLGLTIDTPLGRGDCHRRYLGFPTSFRGRPANKPTREQWQPADALLELAPSSPIDPWYDTPPALYFNPRAGGAILPTTVPSAAETTPRQLLAFHQAVADGMLLRLPPYQALPEGRDVETDLLVLTLRHSASMVGRTTYAPAMGIFIPTRTAPTSAIAVRHPNGTPWTPQELARQPWFRRIAGWDLSFEYRELLFPDYHREGMVYQAATVQMLVRAGVPSDLLSRKSGWFEIVPYNRYGHWLRELAPAFGHRDVDPPHDAVPVEEVTEAWRKSKLEVPRNWRGAWDEMTGYADRPALPPPSPAHVWRATQYETPRTAPPPAKPKRTVSRGDVALGAVALVAGGIFVGWLARGDSRPAPVRPTTPTSVPVVAGPTFTAVPPRAERIATVVALFPRPESGATLGGTGHLGGLGELEVSNGTSDDAVVKLASGITAYVFYVRSSNTATLHRVPPGKYDVQFTTGAAWNGRVFEVDARYQQFQESLVFSETTTRGSTEYSRFRLTLNPVAGGNARTTGSNEAAFLAGW